MCTLYLCILIQLELHATNREAGNLFFSLDYFLTMFFCTQLQSSIYCHAYAHDICNHASFPDRILSSSILCCVSSPVISASSSYIFIIYDACGLRQGFSVDCVSKRDNHFTIFFRNCSFHKVTLSMWKSFAPVERTFRILTDNWELDAGTPIVHLIQSIHLILGDWVISSVANERKCRHFRYIPSVKLCFERDIEPENVE